MSAHHSSRGFSLIEGLVVVALLAMVAAGSTSTPQAVENQTLDSSAAELETIDVDASLDVSLQELDSEAVDL
jgi:prepilin-type N-terminal cleavage/methylation domain-containing protein